MLSRYEAWRSLYLLPPVRPWDGSDVFPDIDPGTPPVGPSIPLALNGSPFPAGWTTNNLGIAVRDYYSTLRNYVSPSGDGMELDDEIKTPFSYRYWALMKWVSDLRKRLLGQPVFPVPVVYDRDGTILSDKEFTDVFHQVHHVWHPNGGPIPSWTQATPGFKTGVGQHRRKQEISRTQVGAEFFAFHRDHLLLFDRWLARTGQDPVQSINTCAHDTTGPGLPPPPAGLDVIAGGLGYPVVNYVTRTVDFSPPHNNMWDGTRAGFDGTLREFASVGEMGQFFATDFNPFPSISVPGAAIEDRGYHGDGHVLNGDLLQPIANNHVPRFYAWHGFIDDVWTKRQPQFVTFTPVQSDDSNFPTPQILMILREFSTSTDSVEPANAIQSLNLATGNGTFRIRIRVRPDPFNRPLDLRLQCDILREASGATPVISLPPRNLVITTGASANPNERQQNVDFIEEFVFDGSAGTVDGDGQGAFAADNLSFPPAGSSAVGFKNSLIRITGYLVCRQQPNGTTPTAAGTVSSVGTTVTGVGTAFTSLFRQGDLIRTAGQVRMITQIASNTSLTVLSAFTPNLPAATTYERLDGFDHEQIIEVPLIQEKQSPDVTVYLDRSSFSRDQVDAIASNGQSVFEHAFYLVVQDRTARPAPLVWPPEVEPQLRGLIAPPIYAAGLYSDLSHAPTVELRDALTDTPLTGQVDVTITAADPEDPSLHPSIPQRITYRCRVTFTGNTAFAGMVAGDTKDLKLVITARDRSGNRTISDSSRVRLQVNANPYMLDGPTSWLSIDTRVFKVQQGQARFGVPAGWTNPNTFIQQVIDNLRAGNGTAGGESFDGLATDQEGSVLEYSTQVGGVNIYNFALAAVRLQSVTGAIGVRAAFRLFRWGVANVEFNQSLAYRTDLASGIALLGQTSSSELASIPFFASPRVPVAAAMTTQTDPGNLFNFDPTGNSEAVSFFGAYLDINQSTLRFPQTFVGDGGFGGVPPADMRSIRDLMIGQHQCMVVEVYYPPDPTVGGATPGTSDNLSQRNLLILQMANPGLVTTRTIQHSFDINLTRLPIGIKDNHHNGNDTVLFGSQKDLPSANPELIQKWLLPLPRPARPASTAMIGHHHEEDGLKHLQEGWLAQSPELLKELIERSYTEAHEVARWQFDFEQWKPTDGLDELVFFWNNLPQEATVEVYLPGASVEEIINYRNLRHAPGTVKIIDSHTLRLLVAGPTYLPIPPFWGDNLAGLVTVHLPVGIKEGQKFLIDVVQMRSDERRVLGGFQLNIQVSKARKLFEPETRVLELFHKRLGLTPKTSRWHPILEQQVDYLRQRARGFTEQAGIEWKDPTEQQKGQKVRLVLERIQILDDQDPCIKGAGEFRFKARVYSRNNGGLLMETRFPEKGPYRMSDKSGQNILLLDLPLFENFVEDHLAVEIVGVELDTFDPDDKLYPYKRVFTGSPERWLGAYAPTDELIEPENLGDWRVWYRIERA